ncbi:MAG: bifunctional transaldolase/phosoglucose isomerase [Anaerolineae bacterium]
MSNPAIEVQKLGQSLWLDYIHRAEIESGDLQRRIDHEGILGVTSNPTIFQKAIGGSDTYNSAIQQMLDLSPLQVYETLAIEDIQRASDLFRPIYESTNGRDGFVSLEVAPVLAHETEGTIVEAKRLFTAVDRPNVMIKIPGTSEGIPAIEESIFAGININVTLLFSIENYEQVAEAYIRGLERRLAAGQDITHVASVASFFLSRIDTAVDRILKNNIRSAQVHHDTTRIAANRTLLGQAAIASAKLAYQAFQRHFKTSRFKKLAERGAQVQRPLWASTSTKDAAYDDTLYVDQLIGEDTVNTVPPQTLAAFIDHGTVSDSLTSASHNGMSAEAVFAKLAEIGVDLDQITQRLQVDGVDAFSEAFDTMIDQVEAKLTVLKAGVMDRQKLALGIYSESVNKALQQVDRDFVNERLWSKDASLWTSYNPERAKIEQRLGWLNALEQVNLSRLQALQAEIKDSTITHVVLLGMGGSSVAPDVLYNIFGKQDDFPELIVLDSTDPYRIQQVNQQITLDSTLFIVASKSGTTIETMAFYRYYWQETGQNGAQFIAITDTSTPLAELAAANQFRECFINPSDIGGRYSALSYFGMVPAAVMGLDLERLWDSAQHMIGASHENIPAQYNPGVSLGVVIGTLAEQGRNKLTVYSTQSIRPFGAWVEQLIAESLGKQGKSVVPIITEAITKPSEYVTDRLFIYLRVDDDPDVPDMDASVRALREAGHPRLTLRLPNQYAVAGEFFRWELGTAIAGYCMGLNPFDEPNVAEAKTATDEELAYFNTHQQLKKSTPLISGEQAKLYMDDHTAQPLRELCRSHGYDPNSRTEVLAAQMAGTHASDYFAFLVYFTPDAQTSTILHEIQRRLRNTTKRAVSINYGPRYLHSTGQLHKGGTNNGIFFLLTHDAQQDIMIPDCDYSFSTLFRAQANGDLKTLQQHQRRVIHIHLGDLQNGLEKILDAVKFVEERRF